MKVWLFLFCLLFSVTINAQFGNDYDTLTLSESPLSNLDSTDIKFATLPSIFDGGLPLTGREGFTLSELSRRYTERWFDAQPDHKKIKFSALPYLGFTYSFGSQAAQFVRAEYAQAFTDSLLLNIDYKRNSGNGYIRNAGYLTNDMNFQFVRKGNFYSFALKGGYFSRSIDHPGGLVTDTLVEPFGLEFSPVWKSNANSEYRRGDVSWTNYFDFNADQQTGLGLVTSTNYSIINRKYQEIDSISGLYPVVNINPDTTFDNFNLPSISNDGGVFYRNKNFYVDARIGHTYWLYSNLHHSRDTNELDFKAKMHLSFQRIYVSNELQLNLTGAFNGWSNSGHFSYEGKKLILNGHIDVSQLALEPFKRFYFANNYDYETQGNLKEFKLHGKLTADYPIIDSLLGIKFSVEQMLLKDNYFFNGFEWKNDTLSTIAAQSIRVRLPFQYHWLNIHPEAVYTVGNSPLIPEWQLYCRIFYHGKLFKAKKLEVMLGADLAYNTAYTVSRYLPTLDVISLYNPSGIISDERFNVHAFLNLGISEFKFYVRFENMAYLWDDQLRPVAENYPMAGTRIRVGITWRFFN